MNGKIDQSVLALLYLTLHDGCRAWKSFDWQAMTRLHEKGLIEDPVNKAKSVVAAVFKARATPASGLVNLPLARGTNVSDGTIPLQFGTDVAMAQITVDPGGSSGWHSHPGGAIIVVKQGSLTVNRSVGSQCQTTTYSAGQAFIARPGEVADI